MEHPGWNDHGIVPVALITVVVSRIVALPRLTEAALCNTCKADTAHINTSYT